MEVSAITGLFMPSVRSSFANNGMVVMRINSQENRIVVTFHLGFESL